MYCNPTTRRNAVAAALVAAGLALAACGGGAPSGAGAGAKEKAESAMSGMSGMSDKATIPANATFNATDVGFAQGMIPHHGQAVEMADLALTRTTNPDVLALAKQIKAAQAPEIAQMTGWLNQWGQKAPKPDAGMDHDMDGMDGMMMGGMLSAADLKKLADAKGADFDRLFLAGMILHHEGAVQMSTDEVAKGKNADAKTLAQAIITSQNAEIEKMKSMAKAG